VEAIAKRRWTLDTARALFDEVRERTGKAVRQVDELLADREQYAAGEPERQALDERIQKLISSWIRAMEALGLEVKGLWLVDFDNGEGYYCWKWPEERLEYFHGYDEGYEGRVRIQ
jgi:hypothetical protein